jgi:hypothetical protein
LDLAASYEKWGGANDGRWHQPGRLLVVLCPRDYGETVDVLLSDVVLHPPRPTLKIAETVALDELKQGVLDWDFNLGQEFKGASGGLVLVPGEPVMHVSADFTAGGEYVGVRKSFEKLNLPMTKVIRLNMRSTTAKQFALRLVDATGQCHQRKSMPINGDGEWHEIEIIPEEIAGGEHWGGANDGTFHQPLQSMEIMLNTRSHSGKQPDLYLSDIRAEVMSEASMTAASFVEEFEEPERFGKAWQTRGEVSVEALGAYKNDHALVLQRSLANLPVETVGVGEFFAVRPGMWQIDYTWMSDLHSPDNSYQDGVALVLTDSGGRSLADIAIGIGFGKADWQAVSKTISIPPSTAKARF